VKKYREGKIQHYFTPQPARFFLTPSFISQFQQLMVAILLCVVGLDVDKTEYQLKFNQLIGP